MNETEKPKLFYTEAEVADILEVSRATISRMVKAGTIPHIVLAAGRRKDLVRIPAESFWKWVSLHTRGLDRGRGRNQKPDADCNAIATEHLGKNGATRETQAAQGQTSNVGN